MNKKPYIYANTDKVSVVYEDNIIRNIRSLIYDLAEKSAYVELTDGSNLRFDDPNFYFSQICTGVYIYIEKAAHREDVEYYEQVISLSYAAEPKYFKVNLERSKPISYVLTSKEEDFIRHYASDFLSKKISLDPIKSNSLSV